MTRTQYKATEYLYMIVGSFLTAAGISLFTVPAKIVDGGVSGIATLLYHMKGWSVSLTTLIISVPLFLLGLAVFGKTYGFKSLLGSLLLSLFLSLFEKLYGLGGILDLSKDSNLLLSAFFGGTVMGIGIGLVMRGGANTGGTDILAQIVSRYTQFSQGAALFAVDGLIILASAFCFGIEAALYGVMTSFVSTKMIDIVLLGFGTNTDKSVLIICDKPDGIEQAIMDEMNHSGTIFQAKGMYTKRDKPVIMCVVSNHEIGLLTRIVHENDPKAFMIVQDAYQVLGEGFTPIEEATWNSENNVTQR